MNGDDYKYIGTGERSINLFFFFFLIFMHNNAQCIDDTLCMCMRILRIMYIIKNFIGSIMHYLYIRIHVITAIIAFLGIS